MITTFPIECKTPSYNKGDKEYCVDNTTEDVQEKYTTVRDYVDNNPKEEVKPVIYPFYE